jgi:two-component system sensor kinase FixL
VISPELAGVHDIPAINAADARVIATGQAEVMEEHLLEYGEPRIFITTRAPWVQDGVIAGVVGVARDVTAWRLAEDRARELERGLWHAARVSSLGETAAALAHELAQPLTSASFFMKGCQLMLQGGKPGAVDQARDGLERATRELARAGTVIENLRRFLRKEGGRHEIIEVNAPVLEAADLAARGFEQSYPGQTVHHLADDLPAVSADRTQLMQIVLNLARNALEAMTPRGDANDTLRLETRRSDDFVEIVVQDTGPGMAPDVAANPFRPFESSKPGGLGLGLSICRSIVEAHRGTIAVASGPKGTMVTVRLPVARLAGAPS